MDCVDVSVILPLHNAEKWLDECLLSVLNQQFQGRLELSVYNDASTDNSAIILNSWILKLEEANIKVVKLAEENSEAKGVGYAKNRAVEQSSGHYLCFLDADDVMHSTRVQKQYDISCKNKHSIIGCKFHRIPIGSTERFTKWANSLNNKQLYTQVKNILIYTSHGPTLIMPTWFCHRDVFDKVGGFSEIRKGFPEDLVFFYTHLRFGGMLYRVDEDLLMYRYHPEATTFSIHENTIWDIRINEIESNVLSKWSHFTIWNAGKQGRKFYRSLSSNNRKKVTAFCDVDQKKIDRGIYVYEESKENPKPTVPIVHFSQALTPFVICVKLDLTDGRFEENLSSLKLSEGSDYYHFN